MNNFLIGTIKDGLRKDVKPWAIPEDSFDNLINAYQWRGRIIRRQGYNLLGQLSKQVTSLNLGVAAQNFTANIFASAGLSNVYLIPGSLSITVNGGANYTLVDSLDIPGTIIKKSGAGLLFLNGSINYLTTDLALNFSANPGGNVLISFLYAPLLPVMGLRTRELFAINAQDLIGFDTKFSYRYSNINQQFQELASVMPVTWSGADWQFFWTTNYAGAFWATNSKAGLNGIAISNITQAPAPTAQVTTSTNHGFITGQTVVFINVGGMTQINGLSDTITVTGLNTFTLDTIDTSGFSAYTGGGLALNSQVSITGQDGIRYYADTSIGTTWVNYNPPIDANNALAGSLLIFPYRGYLVFLNTTEGNESGTFNFGNRARWMQIGTPYYSAPVPNLPNPQGIDIDAGRDDLFGRGGANDAPTQEVIVSAGFIRDILIVNFERSTWRLRFVNNAQNPFVWERINTELGASATFSAIQFDRGLMAIGERGIVISDANDTARFDEKIPDQIFQIRISNDGMQRVYGIRTFRTKLNYWTYPSGDNPTGVYPDKVLIYNYETQNWAFFDDTFTCFGYQYSFSDRTWADLTDEWSSYDWLTWNAAEIEQGYEQIVAGNQQGFVFALEQTNATNSEGLYLTAVTNGSPTTFTSPNNSLPDGTWVELSGLVGTIDSFGYSLNSRRFKIVNPSNDANNFTLEEFMPIDGGNATGTTYTFTLSPAFTPIYPGSVSIYVGSWIFQDTALDGNLIVTNVTDTGTGTINYSTGLINLSFSSSIGATQVEILIVSVNPNQGFSNLITSGTYAGGGYLIKVSNINITTKIFNFLKDDKRTRLSKIDFYVNSTTAGEFTVDILGDSSNVPINMPLNDNPKSNVVLTTQNPYQVGSNDTETIFRLYCDAISQTVQAKMYLSDQQMAVKQIQSSDIELLGMNFTIRKRARLV